MSRKPERWRSTSVSVSQDAFNRKPIEVPKGLVLRTKAEKLVWKQFSECRIDLDWRDSDLIFLARAVSLEMTIRAESNLLSKEGTVLEIEGGQCLVSTGCSQERRGWVMGERGTLVYNSHLIPYLQFK